MLKNLDKGLLKVLSENSSDVKPVPCPLVSTKSKVRMFFNDRLETFFCRGKA
jgi:hypothetical protein